MFFRAFVSWFVTLTSLLTGVGTMSSIFSMILNSSAFFVETGLWLLPLTMQSLTYSVFQNFSRNFNFLMKGATSDLDSPNVPLVVGQNVGPLVNSDISSLVKLRLERLRTLTFVSVVFGGAPRFLN